MFNQPSVQQLMYSPPPSESPVTDETYDSTGLFRSPVSLALICSWYSWVPLQLSHFQLRRSQPAAEMPGTSPWLYMWLLSFLLNFCCYSFRGHWFLSGWSSIPSPYWQWLLECAIGKLKPIFFFELVTLVKMLNSMPLYWSFNFIGNLRLP